MTVRDLMIFRGRNRAMADRRKGFSVAGKLSLGAILLVLVSIVVTSYVAISRQTTALEEAEQRTADIFSSVVSLMATSDFMSHNFANLKSMGKRLPERNPSVLQVSMYDKDNNQVFFFQTDRQTGTSLASRKPIQRQIEAYGQHFGSLMIVFDRSPIERAKQEALSNAFNVGLGLMIITLFGTLLWAKIFSRPIELIAAAAEKVAHGDLTVSVDVTTSDEIGQLTENFNTMVFNLQESRTNLERTLNELSTLYSVSKIINTTSDLEEILKLNIETLKTGFGFSPIVILLEVNHEWRLAAFQKEGEAHADIPKDAQARELDDLGLTEMLDADEARSVDATKFPQQWGFGSLGERQVYAVPLKSGDVMVGILIAGAPAEAGRDEIQILSVIGSQIAPPVLISILQGRALAKLSNPFDFIVEKLGESIEKASQYGADLAVFSFTYSDTAWNEGAIAMEQKFATLTDSIKKEIEDVDFIVRYGVNKLIAIVPGYSKKEARSILMTAEFPDMDDLEINFVTYPEDADTAFKLLGKSGK